MSQSRKIESLIERSSNEFTFNYNDNIGPNVNLKIPLKNFSPSLEEKEFFKRKLKVIKKTEICKNWALYRNCYYGDNCSFAHGKNELRYKPIKENPRYKTKPCKAYYETMYCSFGSRCQYSHNFPTFTYREKFNIFCEQLLSIINFGEPNNFDLLNSLEAVRNNLKLKR